MKLLAKMGILSLLAGATATTLVYGEPQGGWLSPNGQNAASASSGAVGATAGVRGSMTLADMRTRGQMLHEQSRVDARHIQHLQQVARQAKDVIKLNCVNDKLVQVKPQMNMFDSHAVELEGAVSDGDRFSAFEGMSISAENIHRLREEADQCIGEPSAFGGDSSNSFTGPTAPDDPTKGFTGKEIEPPGYASPFN